MHERRAGFTLIELLVVVMIIGILASLAAPNYQNALIHAEAARAAETIHHAEEAVLMAIGEYGPEVFVNYTVITPLRDDIDRNLQETHLDEYLTPEMLDLDWGVISISAHARAGSSRRVRVSIYATSCRNGRCSSSPFGLEVAQVVGKMFGPRWVGSSTGGSITVYDDS